MPKSKAQRQSMEKAVQQTVTLTTSILISEELKGYTGLQLLVCTSGYKGLQWAASGYSELKGATKGYLGLQWGTMGFKKLRGDTRCYEGATRDYEGATRGTSASRSTGTT